MKYMVALEKSDEEFSGSCPGLPGCWSQGETEAEAIDNIKQAIMEYVSAIKETLDGELIREVEVTV